MPFARARLRVRLSPGTLAVAVVCPYRPATARGPRNSVSVEFLLCKEVAAGSNPAGSISGRLCSVAQRGRASPWHGEGRGFESHRVHRFGSVRRETGAVEASADDGRVSGVAWSITGGCQPPDGCSNRPSRTAVSAWSALVMYSGPSFEASTLATRVRIASSASGATPENGSDECRHTQVVNGKRLRTAGVGLPRFESSWRHPATAGRRTSDGHHPHEEEFGSSSLPVPMAERNDPIVSTASMSGRIVQLGANTRLRSERSPVRIRVRPLRTGECVV